MIESMLKVFVAAKKGDQKALVNLLRDAGVVHLDPLHFESSAKITELEEEISFCRRAQRVLSEYKVGEESKAQLDEGYAAAVVAASEELEGTKQDLASITKQIEKQRLWGDVTLNELEDLKERGALPRFFSVSVKEKEEARKLGLLICGEEGKGYVLAALVGGDEHFEVPDSFEEILPPAKDFAALQEEAGALTQAELELKKRLGDYAKRQKALGERLEMLRDKLNFRKALEGGYAEGELFAVQGWCPVSRRNELEEALQRGDVATGVFFREPLEDENPPTEVRYPRWVKAMAALFGMLNTQPGYREMDLAPFFMIALPIFAAIILGDAGYGLVLLIGAYLLSRGKRSEERSRQVALLNTLGGATLVYGILVGSYFGIDPNGLAVIGGYADGNDPQSPAVYDMWRASGFIPFVGRIMAAFAWLWDPEGGAAAFQVFLMKLSFILGAIHLAAGRLVRALAMYPDQRALGEIGWFVFILGMLGVIWSMVFGPEALIISTNTVIVLLAAGALLSILFTTKDGNIIKRAFIGLASSLLSWIGVFSDLMSYVRLMAVGLASYYIAQISNQMAADASNVLTWFVGSFIAVGGHAFNLALGLIALFAHGVRLNMLEFSNHAGVQWKGYQYSPFRRQNPE